MIRSVRGRLVGLGAEGALVEVGGVGLQLSISTTTLGELPGVGSEVSLQAYLVVREDALDLYGFLSRAEEELFLLLTSVSHVGPKLAINVLSGLEVEELTAAIAKGDVARLTKIHGVGKKTAERLVLELKEKVKLLVLDGVPSGKTKTSKPASAMSDLISALVNLGYKEAQAEQAAQLAEERAGAEAPFELLFRESLKSLRG